MKKSRLKRHLEETRANAHDWGWHLFEAGLLPTDHPFLMRSGTTKRQDLLDAVWHITMFNSYLDAAEKAGMTTPA